MSRFRVVLVTIDTPERAETISRDIVERRLAACVNIVPGLRSVYSWEGEVHCDDELLLVIKTSAACIDKLRDRILQIHPYDVPEFITIPIDDGSPGHLNWLADQVNRTL